MTRGTFKKVDGASAFIEVNICCEYLTDTAHSRLDAATAHGGAGGTA